MGEASQSLHLNCLNSQSKHLGLHVLLPIFCNGAICFPFKGGMLHFQDAVIKAKPSIHETPAAEELPPTHALASAGYTRVN